MTESSPVRKPQSEYSEPSNLAPVPFKKSRKIRVYSMIQAGLATIYETTPESWEDVVDYDGSDKAAFALRVTGDSMLPRFPAGTIIVVSPQYPPSFSDFVAAYVKDEGGLFKVLKNSGEAKTVRLVSLNPEFPPTERPREEFDWIYRVIEARVTNL
jgi:phage repressor protein C with HTH and peptisase S24 domain